ncbi:glycosyltransferase family 2 protein [Undibacterium sp. TJN19]|uniref:glycosyltransferase family 2 protein n=1 Tax=Undibacterium sp. TJN19 TaxID=3413055 RepID=UPI003BEF8772
MPFTTSVIIPSKNESASLISLLPKLREIVGTEAEIIVVDDGSTDNTVEICKNCGVKVISHPYSIGNGGAIKTGARAAKGEILLFMDADGQHKPEDIPRLLAKLDEKYDMVVGARDRASQAGAHRAVANGFYNRLSSWMVGQKIHDLTSGFRAVNAKKFRKFLYLLPNTFSYPTTITMSFFRAGYAIAYVPIEAPKRIGKSHVHVIKDGFRFILIIIKIGTLYSPQKLFLPISLSFFTTGLAYYLYTYLTTHRFTNMSALMFISAILTFLIGIVSEQVSALHYKDSDNEPSGK